MIKLYKDIIARAFFVALTTLLSAYIACVTVGVTVGVGEQKSMSSILLAFALSISSTLLILAHKTSLTLLTVGILNKLY